MDGLPQLTSRRGRRRDFCKNLQCTIVRCGFPRHSLRTVGQSCSRNDREGLEPQWPFVQRSAYSPAPGNISGVPRSPSSRTAASFRALDRPRATLGRRGRHRRGVHLGAGALERQRRARDAVRGLEPGRHLVRRGAGDRGHALGGDLGRSAGRGARGGRRTPPGSRRRGRAPRTARCGRRARRTRRRRRARWRARPGGRRSRSSAQPPGATRCWETEADIEASSRASAPLCASTAPVARVCCKAGPRPCGAARARPRGPRAGAGARTLRSSDGSSTSRWARCIRASGWSRRRRRGKSRRTRADGHRRAPRSRAPRPRRARCRRRAPACSVADGDGVGVGLVLGRPQVVGVAGGQRRPARAPRRAPPRRVVDTRAGTARPYRRGRRARRVAIVAAEPQQHRRSTAMARLSQTPSGSRSSVSSRSPCARSTSTSRRSS